MAAVGQLAAGIAHDFNNILSVIMGLSELTLMSEELPKGVRGDLHAIYTQGERAAELVRQILDFSRKVDARKERLELSRFVESTLDLLTRTAPSNVKFVLDLEPNSGEIEFNATKLQQVLANLIVNAVHAMPSGGTITIRTERRHIQRTDPEAVSIPCGNWACLSVGDTGMGMSKETAARIFEPFFTTKPAGQGTGLGLAQVYGLITKNGGELDVRSELGVGSTFTIFLPEAGSSSAPGATVLGFAASGSGQTS
jgi:signal transduction histidine kinase